MLSLNSNMKKNPKLTKCNTKKSENPDEIFPIVGIGASAGGLEALENFIINMPSDCDQNVTEQNGRG
jgi:two-component system CheB/CheR fusion protein